MKNSTMQDVIETIKDLEASARREAGQAGDNAYLRIALLARADALADVLAILQRAVEVE